MKKLLNNASKDIIASFIAIVQNQVLLPLRKKIFQIEFNNYINQNTYECWKKKCMKEKNLQFQEDYQEFLKRLIEDGRSRQI